MQTASLCGAHYQRKLRGTIPMDAPLFRTTEERFFGRVNKDGPPPTVRPDLGGCWIWTSPNVSGGSDPSRRYGHMTINGKGVYAHRLSYEMHNGPIPSGLTVDHLCKTTLCVNPTHLEAVTLAENLKRGDGFGGLNARKTHCPYGHEYAGGNLRVTRKGYRACVACARAASKRYYWQRRELAAS